MKRHADQFIVHSQLQPAGEHQVEFLDQPVTFQGQLHRRRSLPLTPKGPNRETIKGFAKETNTTLDKEPHV